MIVNDVGGWISSFLTTYSDAVTFLIILIIFGYMVLAAYMGELE